MATKKAMPAMRRLRDRLCAETELLPTPEKAPGTPGRPAAPYRRELDAALYVARTGSG